VESLKPMDGTVGIAQFEEGIARLSRVLAQAAEHEVTWLERIRSGVLALLAFLEHEPAWGRLLLVDALAAGPQVLERRRAGLGALVEIVDAGRAERTVGGWSLSTPPRLMAEGVVGAVFWVLHARLLEQGESRDEREPQALLELAPSLMSMIVLPYLGRVAASAELKRRPMETRLTERRPSHPAALPIRTTYRTGLVLNAIAQVPGLSNREIAQAAGLTDAGQTSKLLSRLERRGLIENVGSGHVHGEPNAWLLTGYGRRVGERIEYGRVADGAHPRVKVREAVRAGSSEAA
jgi:hypothetical protein